jgi:hypothetical protein
MRKKSEKHTPGIIPGIDAPCDPDCRCRACYTRLKAERDALLGALQGEIHRKHVRGCGALMDSDRACNLRCIKVRAAIRRVKEGK